MLSVELRRCVLWVWNRLLFPGPLPTHANAAPSGSVDSASCPSDSLHWLILALAPAVVLYVGLAAPLLEPDEGRYAQLCREMHTHRHWIIPTLQGLPYLDKPPLFYWLVCVSYSLFGYQIAAARLVPALALHATILAVYALTRRTLGPTVALRAALMLAALPGFACMGRLITLDGLLACCVTVSWLAAHRALLGQSPLPRERGLRTTTTTNPHITTSPHIAPAAVTTTSDSATAFTAESKQPVHTPQRGRTAELDDAWWWLACVACGLGVLTKGPVAVVLLVGPVVAWGWLVPAVARVSARAWAGLAAVVLAVNLPWYAAMGYLQPQFLGYFLWQHNVLRFLKPFDHLQPVWYYLPILAGGALPLTAAVGWALVRSAWANRAKPTAALSSPEHHRNATPIQPTHDRSTEPTPAVLGFWALAAGWCVLFFSLSGCKLPTYILPAFTALAVLGGYAWTRTAQRRTSVQSARWRAWPNRWTGLWVACWLGCALVNGLAVPWYAQQRSPVADLALIRQWCGDPATPVVCYPRNCDSVAFLLGRADLRNVRSKHVNSLVLQLLENRRTVVLFTHRHSLEALRCALPKELRIVQTHSLRRAVQPGPLGWLITDTPWGLCDLACIERVD